MTATSLSLNKYELIASICRDSFEEFTRRFWHCVPGAGKLKWNWHLSLFCEELERMARRVFADLPREYNLVLNLPPGTSKSTVWSILFPAWVWTNMPEAKILTVSHTELLSLMLANKARQVIKSELYQKCFPEVRLVGDAAGHYTTTKGGERIAFTVAGKAPMGTHGLFVIIDDPIDPKKVLSEAELRTASQFVAEDITTRVTDKLVSVIMLVMQRLGVGDPTDVLLEQAKQEGATPIRHICLPAELVRGDDGTFVESHVVPSTLAKRYIDGLLDPVRLSRDALRPFRVRNHFYSTQFLQQPFNKEGGMFKEKSFLRREKAAPFAARRVCYWDRAFTNETGSCETVGTVMAWDGENFFVGPVVKGKWHPDERDSEMLAMATRMRTRFSESHEPKHVIEREPAAGIDSYRMIAKKMAGFKVIADPVRVGKEVRAEPWASQCSAGNVILVECDQWDVQSWIDQHCAFPAAKYKDMVDSSSGAFNWLVNGRTMGNNQPAVVQARTLRLGKREGPRILFMDADEAARTIIEEASLLVQILSPAREGVVPNDSNDQPELRNGGEPGNVALAVGANGGHSHSLPHGLNKCLGQVSIQFADVDPADHQQSWESPVPPYGLPCEKIMARSEHAKAMWECLLKSHAPTKPEVIAIIDDTDGRRAQSAAMAVCDAMGLPRPLHLSRPDEAWIAGKSDPPSNRHVYETMKKGRWSVPGR